MILRSIPPSEFSLRANADTSPFLEAPRRDATSGSRSRLAIFWLSAGWAVRNDVAAREGCLHRQRRRNSEIDAGSRTAPLTPETVEAAWRIGEGLLQGACLRACGGARVP
jgi:hypothetical protein